ncbi:MerR family transcriptional regulator [Angustibacter aerolatus]
MSWTVGQVASMSSVSVRTLHHYEAVGLVVPQTRTAAGYRQYGDADLARLRDVLTYRELGFTLEQVAQVLDGTDRPALLREQLRLVRERIAHLHDVRTHLERMTEAHDMGIDLTPEEQLEVFGEQWLGDGYPAEARGRWGDTDAWAQSQQRTAGYGKEDWRRVMAASEALETRLAAACADGVDPTSTQAMDLAEEHRAGLAAFYDCGYPMHRGLGDLYVSDPRFTAHYDDRQPGLAQWLRDAVHANADRHEPAED